MRRVFLTVLDSFGIGALPDAYKYGDEGAFTIKSVSESGKFHIPNLLNLGLGNIENLSFLGKTSCPKAAYGRCAEKSEGKDTTTGHWEIAGIVSQKPFPTFPNGFPDEVIRKFSEATGRKVLCNKPYSGTKVIEDFGNEHIKSGSLIVYTSADSVFQIAAHEDIVNRELLYEYSKKARNILCGDYAVGRVIARPFKGEYPKFYRTEGRHDFSLEPPQDTILDLVKKRGMEAIAIGKINDIFAGKGVTESFPTKNNDDGTDQMASLLKRDFNGLCFINLVDFDMLYGHRRDADGYAEAISKFDKFLGFFMQEMKDEDILLITADHGCDPKFKGTDHTREYIPLLIFGKNAVPQNFGTRASFCDIARAVSDYLGLGADFGESISGLFK